MGEYVGVAVTLLPDVAVTVTATAVIALNDPEVPTMVTVAGLEETAAEELAESVSTWDPAAEPATNEAVTPLGSPLNVSPTAPEKPPSSVTMTVLVALPP
jgi:hypothetical protein